MKCKEEKLLLVLKMDYCFLIQKKNQGALDF